jgi:predicted metal-binding membrane protein
MVALLALGAMRIGWMVVIAGVIAIQKLLPEREIWRWGSAGLLAALAVAAAV